MRVPPLSRRGFTLIELLVVIAIIAMLAGLLLPGLSGARNRARVVVGHSNMRSMGLVIQAFTGDHKGELYNPFLHGVSDPQDREAFIRSYAGNENRFDTESIMPFWWSHLLTQELNSGLAREVAMSPADGETLSLERSNLSSGGLNAGSFYYSPTMWRSPEFFSGAPGCCANPYGSLYRADCCKPDCSRCPTCESLARVSLDQASSPSAKVMLFERADFFQKKRVVIASESRSEPLPPAFNNPRAKPGVLTLDGSVTQADVSILTELAEKGITDPNYRDLLPTDLMNVPTRMSGSRAGTPMDGMDIQLTDGLYPAFFQTTRNGIRGRDLNR